MVLPCCARLHTAQPPARTAGNRYVTLKNHGVGPDRAPDKAMEARRTNAAFGAEKPAPTPDPHAPMGYPVRFNQFSL
jgi:hypothetical protein